MKKIGIVLVALVIATFMVGTASAAQTSFSVAVNDGTARVQTSFTSTTEGDVPPYDETGYGFNLFAIHADQFQMTHMVNTDEGVEVENGVGYSPAIYGLKRIFMDEKITTARVAEGDNASICCDSSAETRVNAYVLNYESVSASNNNQLLFAVNSAGVGNVNVLTTENRLIGNQNGTWSATYESDRMSVSNGVYNLSAEFMSEGCDYPALAPEKKDILCPFHP
jgi:hypothetical protein